MKTRSRGVSLLEVLISIFVVSIGLMYLAALLPVAGWNMARANEADRSATCGRAALRDVKVRNLLDRTKWTAPGSTTKPTLLDPLDGAVEFPNCGYATFATGTPLVTIPRVGLSGMPQSVARRVFIAEGALLFVRPENRDERPAMLNDGTGIQPNKGSYSWMVMVAPDDTVSVIVFSKRDHQTPALADIGPENSKPSERVAVAEFTGSVPIDCSLSMPQEPSAARLGTGLSEYLSTRENDWLMLTNGTDFKWYRVVNVANELDNGARLVTLAGPDWTHDKLDLNGDGNLNELQAVICTGVGGVYTQAINRTQ